MDKAQAMKRLQEIGYIMREGSDPAHRRWYLQEAKEAGELVNIINQTEEGNS